LNFSEASIDPNLIPGCRDISENFVDAKEIFDDDFAAHCSPTQESILRKNRNFFTAGEDNLVLRGVNLYGEKQWVLIADRFLPERSINIISQRYAKLSYMLFKANGIQIDKNGNLPNPPKLESIDDLNEEQLSSLQKVQPPAILNVHRWSMEEDLTLLKAVAMMGSMWAEVRARYIPHRDRGHLRKRYQVLERRIKATAGRIKKHEKLMITKIRSPVQAPTYHFTTHSNATNQFSTYRSDPIVNKTAPPSVRPFATTTKNTTTQSATTVKKSNPSLQPRSDKPSEPKQPKPSATSNSNPKQETHRPAVPPYPVPPPYYHPPHPYMYPPPPPAGYMPYMPPPYGYYPPYYHPGQSYYDEGSRAGYEQLIADPSRGWSQMPHVKSMLESETEVASTIVTQLAKSPSKPPEVANSVNEPEQDKSAVPRDSMIAPSKGTSTKSPAQRILNFTGNKHEAEKVSHASPRSPGQPYPFYGSPMVPMPDPSPGMRPSLFSPGSNFQLDDTRLGSYLPVSPTFPYSHLENSQNNHSLNGYDLNKAFHNTDSGIREVASDTPSNMFNETPDNSRLVDDGTHLLDTDLEAVSALNLLKSPTKNHGHKQADTECLNTKKSLFATVVGNLDENKAKSGTKRRKIIK
jgi:Myb-like DNA-binding domain